MYYNKVEICGVNTAKLKNLSDEEKHSLLLKSRDGDKDARQKLIDGNLRLVLSIIQRFTNRGENLDDLFQVGCIGLIKAVDNFNIDLDVKFSTYAVPMIIGEVRRYLRDNNAIRVSRSVRDLAYKALSAKEILSKKNGRDPTIDEIIALLNEGDIKVKKEEVSDALDAIAEPVSLFDPVYSDGTSQEGVSLMDQISDPFNTDEAWVEEIALDEALKKLGDREKNIINMRFYKGKTQMEIAAEIGISQAQVSRLEKSAIAHIKKFL
ncbi:MAG: RNA polymerase sporulation sigma factor SigG [Ruminococcaceae bacterium]|nr:RNA polymerase sporulation sigma factor SigG [Oscillospiraceae bacterium]